MSDLDDLIKYATSENRVCPIKWDKFWRIMGSPSPKDDPNNPGLPLILGAWDTTSNTQKRDRFIAQIRYSQKIGKLETVAKFLYSLDKEEDWHYSSDNGWD